MIKRMLSILTGVILLSLVSCTENSTNTVKSTEIDTSLIITFVELGADWCIPCKEMRPVMDSIQMKYGSQICVKFIDVIKNPQEAAPYKVEAMPTQVFLDTNNTELFRHIGFYPEDSIHIFLKSQGLIILSKEK